MSEDEIKIVSEPTREQIQEALKPKERRYGPGEPVVIENDKPPSGCILHTQGQCDKLEMIRGLFEKGQKDIRVMRALLRSWLNKHKTVYVPGAWEYDKEGVELVEATEALLEEK